MCDSTTVQVKGKILKRTIKNILTQMMILMRKQLKTDEEILEEIGESGYGNATFSSYFPCVTNVS